MLKNIFKLNKTKKKTKSLCSDCQYAVFTGDRVFCYKYCKEVNLTECPDFKLYSPTR